MQPLLVLVALLASFVTTISALTPSLPKKLSPPSPTAVCHQPRQQQPTNTLCKFIASNALAFCVMTSVVVGSGLTLSPAFADEIGVEKDAPTLYTGETVEICTKRGPLGACLKTELRTKENDNDKAKAYFKDPSVKLRERNEVSQGMTVDGEANALIEKLKQQTEENREKNRLAVELKTFENDQSAKFGPFDRQVVILNTDGKTFTLLQAPQAMRLKNAGFIKDRKFVKQPTAEEIENALVAEGEGLAGALQSLFGGGN